MAPVLIHPEHPGGNQGQKLSPVTLYGTEVTLQVTLSAPRGRVEVEKSRCPPASSIHSRFNIYCNPPSPRGLLACCTPASWGILGGRCAFCVCFAHRAFCVPLLRNTCSGPRGSILSYAILKSGSYMCATRKRLREAPIPLGTESCTNTGTRRHTSPFSFLIGTCAENLSLFLAAAHFFSLKFPALLAVEDRER